MANSYVEAHKGSWRKEKHAAQWMMTLASFPFRSANFPWRGSIPRPSCRSESRLGAVRRKLHRNAGRVEAVLDAAKAKGHIADDALGSSRAGGNSPDES
jgi:hypothetical protein